MDLVKKYAQYAAVVLLVAAALAALIWPYRKALPLVLLAAGAAAVAGYVLLNLSELKNGFRRRSFLYSSNLLLVTVLVLGIVVLVNIVGSRFHHRFDFTEAGLHSLSPQSVQVVKALKAEVVVRGFPDNAQFRDRMDNLLKMYAYYNPSKFKYELFDPWKNPNLIRYYKITEAEHNAIVFESGGRQDKVTTTSEEDLTNALIKVTREQKKTIYFLEGHGEASIDDTQPEGYSSVKDQLAKLGYEVKKLGIALQTSFPKDCSVLVVPGPKKDLLPEELKAIKDYIDQGGKAFFFYDPQAAPALAGFLGGFGFRLRNDVVVDEISGLMGGGFYVPAIASYENHEITKGFRYRTFFPLVRSVEPESPAPPGVTVQALAKTSETSWAETNFDPNKEPAYDKDKDAPGPISVAAVATVQVKGEAAPPAQPGAPGAAPEKKEGRLAVFGSSNFVTNQFIGRFSSNGNLFMNTINWLTQESDLISIQPKTAAPRLLNLTDTQKRVMGYISLLILPLLVLATGIVIWLRRRSL